MVFVETSVFTRHVIGALTDDQYGQLQGFLLARSGAGDPNKGQWRYSQATLGITGSRQTRWRACDLLLAGNRIPNPNADAVSKNERIISQLLK